MGPNYLYKIELQVIIRYEGNALRSILNTFVIRYLRKVSKVPSYLRTFEGKLTLIKIYLRRKVSVIRICGLSFFIPFLKVIYFKLSFFIIPFSNLSEGNLFKKNGGGLKRNHLYSLPLLK